jgi:uncharacterized RDD family membrane protein YckC
MNTTNPYAPPQAAVQDVTDSGDLVLAGRGARLGAAILDGLIVILVMYVPLIVAVKSSGQALFVNARFNSAGIGNFAVLLPVAGLLAVGWLNYLYVSRNGQSIAKKIVGIKLVRADGSPVSVARVFWLRNVLNTAIGSIPLAGAVYWLVDALLIFGERRQCMHDKIADTIVINA